MTNPLVTQNPNLLIKEIKDVYVLNNFKSLSDYFQANNQLLDFKFFEIVLTKAVANYTQAHGLGYIPRDVVITQITGPGQVTINYGLFDATNINLTVTDACRIRIFIGTYYNFQSSVNANKTDAWVVNPPVISSDQISQVIAASQVGQVAVFSDVKAANTPGGTFTAGAWRTRTINTSQKSQDWAALASSQITLHPGTYLIETRASAYGVDSHQAKWYNVTSAIDSLIGTSEQTTAAAGVQTSSIVQGVLTLPSATTFELRHQCQTTKGTTGFGAPANMGVVEVFATVNITKLA